jgi:class 3 adenylate cyclase
MNTTGVPVPGGGAEQILVLLLTDVESSTQHWMRDPERMPAALDVLDVAVERSMSKFGGEIVRVRGEGDSHFVVFARASAAVRAAAALQRGLHEAAWPGAAEFRVRIAIHAGEVQRRDGDYAGVAIHHAARLRSTRTGARLS